MIENEAELGRRVRDNTVQDKVAEVMTRLVAKDYIQHDPNAPGNGRDLLIEHFRRVPAGGITPPPVVSVVVEGDLGCVMMTAVFRVRGGKLIEPLKGGRKLGACRAALSLV